MSEVMTRFYLPGDEEQIVPLLKTAFQGWPFFDIDCSPVDHWRWRYLDNPQYRSNIVVLLDEDRVVACGHNVLHYLMINGYKVLASYGTDACIHPEYQGKGLYRILVASLMNRQKEMGVEFNYMVTVEPRVINSRSQRAATPNDFPYRVKYFERVEDINLHMQVRGLSGEYGWRLKHFIEQARSKPIKPREMDVDIRRVEKFEEDSESFLEEMCRSYDYIKYRTPEYLNWRYLDPRGGNYNVEALYENGFFKGYGVFRINKLEDYHIGYIVDILTLPHRIDLAESLMLSGLDFFKRNQVNHVVYQVVEGHPYEELFKKYGFYGEEANRHIFYNNHENENLNIEKIPPKKIHFPFGDLTGI